MQGERDIAAQAQQLEQEGVPTSQRAQTAFEARNALRSAARAMMDPDEAAALNANEPNGTFEELVAKYEAQGYSGDQVYEQIIQSASRSRPEVNQQFGLSP